MALVKKHQSDKTQSKKQYSRARLTWIRYRKSKLAMLGLVTLCLLSVIILTAPLYLDYSKVTTLAISERFQGPSLEHWFGTDEYGRDLFARIIYGGRISLFSGIASVSASFLMSLVLGSIAGFYGGKIETIIMRICDMLMALPPLILSMAIVTALGQGLFKMLIALSIASVPGMTRTVRAAVMTLRNQEFIEAAVSCGTSKARIIFRHLIPNIIAPIMINVMLGLGGCILRIASLGFLGIGIAPPTPEWGTIISENQTALRYYPYLGIFPGLFIMITVLSFNFIGDGLRDALDPKMKN